MKGKKLIIVLIVVFVILGVLLSKYIKNSAATKKEMNTFNGLTREEFKSKLEKAWKDKFYKVTIDGLRLPEDWARDWRLNIDENVATKGVDFETALLGAASTAYAKDNPKASDNVWSTGWLSEIYVRQQLKLDPNDPDIRAVILEV